MPRLKIGIVVECLNVGVRRGLSLAAQLGIPGIQVDVTRGDLAPENLSSSGCRDFLAQLRSHNLQVSAVSGNLGRGGFANPDYVDEVIGRTKRFIDLAVELRVPTIATYIGRVPEGEDSPWRTMMTEALNDVGRYAENYERFLATETGAEDASALAEFLESLDTEGIKVNYDPGNLVMNGFDPVAGVFALGRQVLHTHAKDGVRHPDGTRQEAPLGEGDVDWLPYFAALDSMGYDGFYTIEGDMGPNPVERVRQAKQFLEKF